MTVIHAILQTPFKSQRKLDTNIFNIARFTPGSLPPILPYLNICNMIPDSSTSVYDPHTKTRSLRDDWVFQGVVLYAHPEQEYHPDYANKPACKRNLPAQKGAERSFLSRLSTPKGNSAGLPCAWKRPQTQLRL
ncbi:hypothetical protein RSAG8_03300, partial [Rhizoctonia solani AG-8 WAC10335]